jgi:hypothetical protein
MLVKKSPFTRAELDRIASWAAGSHFFGLSAAPHLNAERRNAYQFFLALEDRHQEERFTRLYPFDVRPIDDNRPFFFRYSYWWHLLPREPVAALEGWVPVMELSLLMLLATAAVAAAACIYLPLRFFARSGVETRGAARYAVFFGCVGLGYMAIEVALIQKFGLLLGHPNHALSVVLAALLLATGLGSLLSQAIVRVVREVRFAAYLLAVFVLAQHVLVFPRLQGLIQLSFAARCLIVFLLVAPIGLCLGTFFPSGLERLERRASGFVPWAWGINGIFSVLGPMLSVAISTTWGIEALLLSSLPIYLAAALALPGPRACAGGPERQCTA